MNEMKKNDLGSHSDVVEPFGSRRPALMVAWMIGFLHSSSLGLLQRLFAPIVRKIVINFSDLPIDIQAGKLKLRCQFSDNYSEKKYVFTPWRYDVQELQALKDALPDDGVFLDIGANVGLYTLTAAQVMGRRGRILAFEPNVNTLQRLNYNLQANHRADGGPSIEVLNIGIADENAERLLQIDNKNLGACSIADTDKAGEKTTIRCKLLLDVLREQKVPKIDVLKIDIEGAEDIALTPFIESADEALFPRLIIIENSDDRWSVDLFGMLAEKGYRRILKTRLNTVLKK